MLPGAYTMAGAVVADSPTKTTFETFLDAEATARQQLHQVHPYLELWDVEYEGGLMRFADFGHPDARSAVTPHAVTFRGNEYHPIRVARTDIPTAQGTFPTVQVSIADPLRYAMTFFLQNNVAGRIVTLWRVRYDLRDYGETHATSIQFRIRNITFQSDAVVVTLGAADGLNQDFPKAVYLEGRCINDWNLRHDPRNRCTYGNDEFEEATAQDFLEEASRFGWSVAFPPGSGDQLKLDSGLDTGVGGADLALISRAKGGLSWLSGSRAGTFVYRTTGLEGQTEDFDCYTKVYVNEAAGARTSWLVGILAQSADDPSDWLLWGQAYFASSDHRLQYRRTIADVTTQAFFDVGQPVHSEVRMAKAGDEFRLYSRPQSVIEQTFDDGDWTEHALVTLDLAPPLRIGLVFSAEGTTSDELHAYAKHFRFLSGFGYPDCNRSDAACALRHNQHQRNDFRGLPDGSTYTR